MKEIIKIYPSIEQLDNNTSFYHKRSIKKAESINTGSVCYQYHCPFDNCKYFSEKFFTAIKFLRQHYRKIHMQKKFICCKCNKAFALESFLKSHYEICGITFSCSCGSSYPSFEALCVHTKRKNHQNGLKFAHIKRGLLVQSQLNISEIYDERNANELLSVNQDVVTEDNQLPYKFYDSNETLSKETQTSTSGMSKISSHTQTVSDTNCKRSVSMQTLVPKEKNNFFLESYINCSDENLYSVNKSYAKTDLNYEFISSSTQTSPLKSSDSLFKEGKDSLFLNNERQICQTLVPKERNNFYQESYVECNNDNLFLVKSSYGKTDPNYEFISSSTQTSPLMKSDHHSFNEARDPLFVNTEVKICNDLYFDMDVSDNSNSPTHYVSKKLLTSTDPTLVSLEDLSSLDDGKLCTSETQTEKISFDGLLDYLLDNETQTAFTDYFEHSYNDTFTQTCNSLLTDLDFVNIETQTPWSLFDN